MKNKIISLCLTLCVVFILPLTAFADGFVSGKKGSVSVELIDNTANTPVAGAELTAYHVATVSLNSSGDLVYVYTDEFDGCGIALDDSSITSKLDTYIQSNSVSALKAVTDAKGKAVFSNLPVGLYFVKQMNAVAGYAPCRPFIVTVPYKKGNRYIYSVDASPKTDIARLTDITIKKVWNTDESTKIADKVTIQLLRDGAVIETLTLSKSNGWKVTVSDMPESDAYSVVEINVPNGFTPTYSHNGYEFTVTNTASLIETGQLVWPVPILAMAGILFITLGYVALRRQEDADE